MNWEEITLDHLVNLNKVLDLYDKSFPIEVREPHEIFLKGLQSNQSNYPNRFRVLIGLDGDELVSFVTAHYLADLNVGFIVYIVTNPYWQKKGIGALTLLKIEELLKRDAKAAGQTSLGAIVLETEKKDEAHTSTEVEECLRRDRFFHRNGYIVLKNIAYIQPPLHENEKSVPLNLVIKKLDSGVTDTNQLIQAMYREKYWKVNGISESVLTQCLKEMDIHTSLS